MGDLVGNLDSTDRDVRSADVTHQPAIDKLLHLSPCPHVVLVDVWQGVRIAFGDIASRRMMIREGPMDQIKVQIVDPKVLQRPFARRNHVVFPMFVIPEFRRDPELIAMKAMPE